MRAYGKLLAICQELGPFPAGLVLHAWAGPPEIVAPLAGIEGVHFSVSGHVTRLQLDKAAAMLKQVPFVIHIESEKAQEHLKSRRLNGTRPVQQLCKQWPACTLSLVCCRRATPA